MSTPTMKLADYVRADVAAGSIDRGTSLGIKLMPDGYNLMQVDSGHYYWLRDDGRSGKISCDKWQVWRWAIRSHAQRKSS